jgi:hypothetical protein
MFHVVMRDDMKAIIADMCVAVVCFALDNGVVSALGQWCISLGLVALAT